MQIPALPENEVQRLQALHDLKILDSSPEERFDRLTRLAQNVLGTQMALVSLVDAKRQWFKSCQGLDACETGRDISFCGHAILDREIFEITDASQDPRFFDNPLVTESPHIRFYAGAPLSTPEGYRIGTLCIIADKPRKLNVTERKILRDLADCVEDEINQIELVQQSRMLNQFRSTLDRTLDCVFMFDAVSLRFYYVNEGATRQVGYTRDELLTMYPYDIKPYISQEQFQELIAPLLSGELDSLTFETTHQHKHGRHIPVEIFLQYIAPEGEHARFVAIVRDVSERKQAEAALRDREGQVRAIVETVVDGIVTINEKGTIETFNPAAVQIFGYKPEEVIGHNVKMLMPEPFHDEHDGYLRNYMSSGKAKVIGIGREVTGRRKDGSVFPMELAVSEMQVAGRRMFTGIVRNITERKRIDRMKNEFISTVSHELRTPLTSIRGSLGLITGGVLGELSEQVKAMLNIASNNTERLLMLINDILDIQKIEAGKMAFRFENVTLMPLIEKAVTELAAYATQHGVRYEITHRLEDIHVYADRDRLMQVFANLMSNAAKFSPTNSLVEISAARHSDGRLRISITDRGPGISENFKPQIFQPFSQSDSSDTRSKGGTGLGLAITKAIIDKHGGNIGFISREGIGTTFYVELPEMRGGEQNATDKPRILPNKHHACVLIVEDDPDIAALIQRMLTETGYDSDIAYNAKQARKLLAENNARYRLMTLDLLLPDEDGMSLLESLRRDTATQGLPVVVVSVMADEVKQQLIGGALDIKDWLQKPIDPTRLITAIKTACEADRIPRVLHVEDEPDVRAVVGAILKGRCDLVPADSVAAARKALATEKFDLVLLDICLPDGSGLDLIDFIEQYVVPPRIIIFSASEVTEEYANKVSGVLVKSRTGNDDLLRVMLGCMRNE